MNYRLSNGEVVLPQGVFEKDLVIEDGKITMILERGEPGRADLEEIDCSGKVIMPGLIDVHVHFREPGQSYKEDWVTGSKAAVSGGVTTVFDMPNNQPPIVSVADLEAKRKLIEGRSYVNYGLYIGFNGHNLQAINEAKNIPAVKFYACDSTGDMGVSDGVEELFEGCNKLIVVHSEDGDIIKANAEKYLSGPGPFPPVLHSKIRSVEAAVKSTQKLCELVKKTGHRLHIAHLSTAAELEIVQKYREFGVTCEVSPHHLHICTDDYQKWGSKIRMNPPVREREDLFALWKGIKHREVDMIATDHAPHTLEEKMVEDFRKVPSGVPGVEMMLPLLLNAVNSEGLTLEEVVKLCCERPAEVFGLLEKGRIEVGYDADLVVVDLEMERLFEDKDVVSKCGWSPYSGVKYQGWPVMTFVNGVLAWNEGMFGVSPSGKEARFTC